MTDTPNTSSARPLAVWPCAQDATSRVWAEIAQRAVEHYSEPGDLIVDSLCTDPAVPLEAIRHRRNAIAVIRHEFDARELNEQLRAARPRGADGNAVLLRGNPLELPRLLAQHSDGLLRRRGSRGVAVHPAGSADLVIVALPAALRLGRQRPDQLSALDVLRPSAVVLRPGGYLVAVSDCDGNAVKGRDLGSETVALCEEVGLAYWQHVVALLVPIEDSRLQPPAQRLSRDATPGLSHLVHQDVHVFRKPTVASGSVRQRNEVDGARWAA